MIEVLHVIGTVIAVAVIAAVVIADHWMPDSPAEQLRRTYRGAYMKRRRRGQL